MAARAMHADSAPKPGVALGAGAYAAYGVEAAVTRPHELMPIMLRENMLASLFERGILKDYLHGEELDEKVFSAAATMPCNKQDWEQAMFPAVLAQFPADQALKVKEEARAAGIDLDNPPIDGKFLDWLRSN